MASSASADRLEPLLALGMSRVGKYSNWISEDCLDFGNRQAVLAAFFTVAVVPLETSDIKLHTPKMSIVHTFVNGLDAPAPEGSRVDGEIPDAGTDEALWYSAGARLCYGRPTFGTATLVLSITARKEGAIAGAPSPRNASSRLSAEVSPPSRLRCAMTHAASLSVIFSLSLRKARS